MSLNLPSQQAYYRQQHIMNQRRNDMPPPPAWNNSWGAPNMYPYGAGMQPGMNQGNIRVKSPKLKYRNTI